MAALLTSVTGNTDDVVKYINECREMGIAVEAPDINVSDANFTPHGSAIRFGLAAVKNVGHNAIESIVAGRKELGRYSSDLRILREGRPAAAEQARAGVADQERRHGWTRPPRAADGRPRPRHRAARRRRSAMPRCGQHGLFGVFQQKKKLQRRTTSCPILLTGTNTPGWPTRKKFSASSSAAIRWKNIATSWKTCARSRTEELGALYQIHRQGRKHHHRRHHHQPARAEVEARRFLRAGSARRHGRLSRDAGVPRGLSQAAGKGEAGSAGADPGRRAHRRRRESQADGERDSFHWKTPRCRCRNSLRIRVPLETANESTVDALHTLCAQQKGEAKVLFDVERQGDFMVVMEAEGYNVLPDRNFHRARRGTVWPGRSAGD